MSLIEIKKFASLLIFIFISIIGIQYKAQAQFGLTARHTVSFFDFDDTRNVTPRSHSWYLSADYMYRMKNYRMGIALAPFVRITDPSGQFISAVEPDKETPIEGAKAAGVHVYAKYHPLDLLKCDCPRINKKGLWFKQSFYLMPQVGYEFRKFYTSDNKALEGTDQLANIGLLAGVDLYLFYPVIISPQLGVEKYFQTSATNINFTEKHNPWAFTGGIRVGIGLL
jgi:hypothetical protein